MSADRKVKIGCKHGHFNCTQCYEQERLARAIARADAAEEQLAEAKRQFSEAHKLGWNEGTAKAAGACCVIRDSYENNDPAYCAADACVTAVVDVGYEEGQIVHCDHEGCESPREPHYVFASPTG